MFVCTVSLWDTTVSKCWKQNRSKLSEWSLGHGFEGWGLRSSVIDDALLEGFIRGDVWLPSAWRSSLGTPTSSKFQQAETRFSLALMRKRFNTNPLLPCPSAIYFDCNFSYLNLITHYCISPSVIYLVNFQTYILCWFCDFCLKDNILTDVFLN